MGLGRWGRSRWPVLGVAVGAGWIGALTLRASTGAVVQDPAPAVAPQVSAEDLAKQAYAIFKQHCIECHGAAKESGLDLRTETGLQGSNGRQ